MSDLSTRDVEYRHDGTRMLGYLCSPETGSELAAVLLVPDAYGVTTHVTDLAARLALRGHPVFVADVWGDRLLPRDAAEFGPLIGEMAAERDRWLGRIRAAHTALLEQPETSGRGVVVLGYCFGGSSALELVRTGTQVAGVISVHGGLDIIEFDWSQAASAPVLVIGGDADPMGTAEMRSRLAAAMTTAGVDWQLHVYSDTVHAFTSPMVKDSPRPDVVAYSARSTARAWAATLSFLREFGNPLPSA
ncbi:dienelactone hydrolase family protein [Cryptosporangium sp. NPDC048952]|uniref:dienelactone hydrolase family protein n=1 Tax=Cryptosporangium sp. NPDC048952 TaxID=3363961 RepID=UPI00370FA463